MREPVAATLFGEPRYEIDTIILDARVSISEHKRDELGYQRERMPLKPTNRNMIGELGATIVERLFEIPEVVGVLVRPYKLFVVIHRDYNPRQLSSKVITALESILLLE